MKSLYTFPAIFEYADDGISIEFPDLPGCLSCADTTEEALINAEEALGLFLYGIERDGEDTPSPTPLENIACSGNQKAVLVKVWMPIVRHEIENTSIKKTLTIPQWLNEIAEENKVNFSQILQAALKDYLNLRK
ncbi:MAG TPA: type II toxin-antitoxin system HicB family antitoxin [Clostridia bacterium]|nr:type II toxin-antitoxin system HicB family antitoxin [Clostridia bacterium]